MKSLITMVVFLAAVLVNCMSAYALSFGGSVTTLKCANPPGDRTPTNPLTCSLHVVLNERGGSAPTVFEVVQATITVPSGTAALVCTNGGGNVTYSPGLGGVTFISLVGGANILNNENGNFLSDHRFLDDLADFDGNVVAFRQAWGLPVDRTLCRNKNFTELTIIAPEIFITGAIYKNCTTPNDPTTCELDATIQATCTVKGKVTPGTSYTYDCKNIVVNNNP